MPTTQIYVPLSMKRNPIVYSSFKKVPERRTKSYKFKSHYCVTSKLLYYVVVPRWVRNEVDASKTF